MNKTNVKVEFSIIGDNFCPTEITSRLSISPSSKFRKGDTYIKNGNECIKNYSCWMISTGYEESLDISIQLDKIVAILDKKKDELVALRQWYAFEYMLVVVINIENRESPGMYIKSDVIKFVNDINAEIDLDLYIMS